MGGRAVAALRVEDGPDALALGREQTLTAEQVARVLIGDRQRIAIEAIAGPEVALEVRRPEIIRSFRRRGHHPRVRVVATPSALLDQAAPSQDKQPITAALNNLQLEMRAQGSYDRKARTRRSS